MLILVLTIPVTVTLVTLFIVLFVMATKDNQFEDLETPKHSPLSDDEEDSEIQKKKVLPLVREEPEDGRKK